MVAANIAALRKGFKNQWKSWFGGQRPASEREGVTLIEGRPPLYAHIALEAQMRQFADLVFMLGDYDLALQVRLVGVGLALGWRRLVGVSSDCWRGRVRPPRQKATLLRSSCSPIVAPHRYWFNVHRGESTYDLPTAAGVAAGRLVGAGVLVDRRHVSWPFNRHFPTPFPNALSQRSAGSPTRDRSTPSILSAARHSGHLRAQ